MIFIYHRLMRTATQAKRASRTLRPWKQRALLMSRKSFLMLPRHRCWQAPNCPKAKMYKVLREIMEENSSGRRSETNASRLNKVFRPSCIKPWYKVFEPPKVSYWHPLPFRGVCPYMHGTPSQTCVCLWSLRRLWVDVSETKLEKNKSRNNLGLWMTWPWWTWKRGKSKPRRLRNKSHLLNKQLPIWRSWRKRNLSQICVPFFFPVTNPELNRCQTLIFDWWLPLHLGFPWSQTNALRVKFLINMIPAVLAEIDTLGVRNCRELVPWL